MTTTLADDTFENEDDRLATPEVAIAADISDSSARAYAVEIGVQRIETSYVWSKENFEELLALLDDDDDDDDEADGDQEEEDEQDDDSIDDDEEADSEDEDDEE